MGKYKENTTSHYEKNELGKVQKGTEEAAAVIFNRKSKSNLG